MFQKKNLMDRDIVKWFFNLITAIVMMVEKSLLFLLGLYLISNHQITQFDFLLFIGYSEFFSKSLTNVMKIKFTMQPSIISLNRLFSIIDYCQDEVKIFPDPIVSIELVDVVVKRNNKKILDNFNWTFVKNHCYGIVGRNGSGKTTLLESIAGLCRVHSGFIYYNGTTLSSRDMLISNQIAFLEHDNRLFVGTVWDNIFDDTIVYSDFRLELINLCKIFAINNDIESLPEKYDTKIDEFCGLSAGQQRKILLVQVFARKTPIVLLDEPLANIDRDSANDIVQAIDILKNNRIIIIATHEEDKYNCIDDFVELCA